jgi:hypothetical protein
MTVQSIEPLAVFTDYRDLVVALRHRIAELGTHMEAVDEVAGLPTRYTAKVLSLGQARPALGRTSMGPILQTLGLKLALMADNEALARIRRRLPLRGKKGPQLQAGADGMRARRRQARELAAALMRLQSARSAGYAAALRVDLPAGIHN